MKRWVCPLCRSGVLAGERPRHDDVKRFCLPCSKRTGKMVKRTCPAKEFAKMRRHERNVERSAKTKAFVEERLTAYWTVAGHDLRMLAPVYWDALCNALESHRVHKPTVALARKRLPKITIIRRNRPGVCVSGCAHGTSKITLCISLDSDSAAIRATLLHELAHCARDWALKRFPETKTDGPHGKTYNRLLARAAESLFGPAYYQLVERGYATTRLLEDKLRAADAAVPRLLSQDVLG